jgi:hypothetical protein
MRRAYWILAFAVASCGMSPDSSDYKDAAQYHSRMANTAREGARADADAARAFASQGQQSAAEEAERSAREFAEKANVEASQAAKDYWFGQWWPSFN